DLIIRALGPLAERTGPVSRLIAPIARLKERVLFYVRARRVMPHEELMELRGAADGAVGEAPALASQGPRLTPGPGGPGGPPDRRTLERLAIAELLTTGANAKRIAESIGVSRTTLLGWPDFREAYDRLRTDAGAKKQGRRRGKRVGDRDFE